MEHFKDIQLKMYLFFAVLVIFRRVENVAFFLSFTFCLFDNWHVNMDKMHNVKLVIKRIEFVAFEPAVFESYPKLCICCWSSIETFIRCKFYTHTHTFTPTLYHTQNSIDSFLASIEVVMFCSLVSKMIKLNSLVYMKWKWQKVEAYMS